MIYGPFCLPFMNFILLFVHSFIQLIQKTFTFTPIIV
ncbi:hypothetical protein CLOBOL_00497 [Enterocloster bolteae ATCC BAA-613]|uniref:Uncharacterized protein n=1 Tax=Enterocloster bolteae (strain ATCC BAA-613 / DSM 15670 / CCUG 46953 / JCM 12243 / WAL 16351) TaxID=411902 RepID=A8RHT1_ENTBW|nr:hypothetical protein CLOBOL_00497 [Enterocloster bolteae ATCC BAA-613]